MYETIGVVPLCLCIYLGIVIPKLKIWTECYIFITNQLTDQLLTNDNKIEKINLKNIFTKKIYLEKNIRGMFESEAHVR